MEYFNEFETIGEFLDKHSKDSSYKETREAIAKITNATREELVELVIYHSEIRANWLEEFKKDIKEIKKLKSQVKKLKASAKKSRSKK